MISLGYIRRLRVRVMNQYLGLTGWDLTQWVGKFRIRIGNHGELGTEGGDRGLYV